jgi:hypothetical protein
MTLDTEYDLLVPEMLNILFFEQNDVVIFPYVDVRHLRSLDVFCVGHEIIEVDATALGNLSTFLEYQLTTTHSSQPLLFLIHHASRAHLEQIMTLKNLRCILNTHENVEKLVSGSRFVFYNTKTRQFLNFDHEHTDLEYERSIIHAFPLIESLRESIFALKQVATKLYDEFITSGKPRMLARILEGIAPRYWDKIVSFTENYYHISFPALPKPKTSGSSFPRSVTPESLQVGSDEFRLIVASDRLISQEFVRLIHEYRVKCVNPANLELNQLMNPERLYTYLRCHHWKEGIPSEFIQRWSAFVQTDVQMTDDLRTQFHHLVSHLPVRGLLPELFIYDPEISNPMRTIQPSSQGQSLKSVPSPPIPSIKDFEAFKRWVLDRLDELN